MIKNFNKFIGHVSEINDNEAMGIIDGIYHGIVNYYNKDTNKARNIELITDTVDFRDLVYVKSIDLSNPVSIFTNIGESAIYLLEKFPKLKRLWKVELHDYTA